MLVVANYLLNLLECCNPKTEKGYPRSQNFHPQSMEKGNTCEMIHKVCIYLYIWIFLCKGLHSFWQIVKAIGNIWEVRMH